jgi:uncharacterized protein YbjQ (UPF0145 family)
MSQVARSVEAPATTQALYEARELAMARMQQDALGVGAEGIVGVKLVQKPHKLGTHVVEFLAVGTGVRARATDRAIPEPQMILTLDR